MQISLFIIGILLLHNQIQLIIEMAEQQPSSTLASISKYKEFLASKNCPENLPDYDDEAYWDARYELEQQEVYDWYVDYSAIKNLFEEFVTPNMKIMELGSGKSAIISDLYKNGFKNLIGSDFSWTLINQRRNEERYLKRGVRWERIDITRKWPDFSVDCFFDKATLDCLPIKEVKETIIYIHEILQKDGVFFHITTAKPENRISLLKMWDVKVYELPKTIIPIFNEIDDSKAYYLYICIK